ncbi:hypothetical protein ACO1O0_003821 [Amphichorda felina]
MGNYRYQSLPPLPETERAPPFTRILCLAPGSGDDPLSGHLEIINAEAAPHPYEALSYTWGTDPPSNYLWLQGVALPIRPSLEAALTFLRLPHHTRLLWVDAVCINQDDVDERSRQVQYMRLVYKNSARALVWVGFKTPGVEDAFKMARRLVSFRQMMDDQKHFNRTPPDVNTMVQLRESYLADVAPGSLQRLYELCHRPYFSRVWCIQEVVAAPEALLKCEELEIPFMHVAEHIILVRQLVQRIDMDTSLTLWYRVWDQRQPSPYLGKAKVEGSLGRMLDLLDLMRSFQATDIRDKIFALQGICDEGLQPALSMTQIMGQEGFMVRGARRLFTGLANTLNGFGPNLDFGRPEGLKVNYRKSAVDVYIDLARFMVRKSPRVLDVLDHVSHASNAEGGEYPSWVPKWFEPRITQTMSGAFLAGFCDGHFRYFAEVHDNPLMGTARDPRTLSIDGFFVDNAYSVSDVLRYETRDINDTVAVIERAWSQLFPFRMSPTPTPSARYRDGQPLDLAFCKTVSAHPLGDGMSLVTENRAPGSTTLTLPDDFGSQISAAAKDGGARARSFLNQLNRLRAKPTTNTAPAKLEFNPSGEGFLSGVRVYSNNRRVFVTRDGHIGLGPMMMQPGDEIVVLFGGRFPFVTRRRRDHHVFIGQCYLVDDELMAGRVTEKVLRHHNGPPRMTYHLR